MKGRVHSFETFGAVDGPGVRFIIFLKGCPLRCQFCHNPDTWLMEGGTFYTAREVLDKALHYQKYWHNGGGITVSGGEALLQIDFLIELFELAHQMGIHCTLDTAGGPFTFAEPFFTKFQRLMKVTDLILLDLKEINDQKHKKLTGASNKNILALAKYLSDIHKPMWIRHVLVPNITANKEDLVQLRKFIDTLKSVEKVEVLPYHTLGVPKYEKLGISYPLKDTPQPTKEQIALAEDILVKNNYTQ